MAEIWGYARVSTADQNPALQIDALKAAGVPPANIVAEHVSGAAAQRPKFEAMAGRLGRGDTLMVWKVDRLGRSTLGALETAKRLDAKGVRIVVTTLGADLTTPAGRLVFGVLAQIAEFERELTVERVRAGPSAAKARGQKLGRRHTRWHRTSAAKWRDWRTKANQWARSPRCWASASLLCGARYRRPRTEEQHDRRGDGGISRQGAR